MDSLLMSKNFCEYENDIFQKVLGRQTSDLDVRFKKFENDDDLELKEFFDALKFEEKIPLLREQFAAIYTFNETRYIFIIGDDKSIFSSDSNGFFNEIDVSVAFFIRAVKDCDLKLRADVQEDVLDNTLRAEHEDSSAYVGHSWEDVYSVFPKIVPIMIPQDSVISDLNVKNQLYFVYSFILDQSNLDISNLLPKYRELIKKQYPTFDSENFFYCFTSVHWKHLFLETYRCLESMFSYAAPLNLKTKLGIDIRLEQLYSACKDELQWQRKEDYSIGLLVQNVDVRDIQSIGFDSVEANSDPSKYRVNVAKYIYNVRNSFVHQSDRAGNVYDFDKSQWLILIELVLLVTLKNSELLIVGE